MNKRVRIFCLVLFFTAAIINAQTGTNITLRGNILQQTGENRYLFRDSTGLYDLVISQDRWGGLYVGPSDLVDIAGELIRNEWTGQVEVYVNSITIASINAPPVFAPAPPAFTPAPFYPAAPMNTVGPSPMELPSWQSGRLPGIGGRTGFFTGLELGLGNFSGTENVQTHFLAYRNAFGNGAFNFYGGIYHSLRFSEDLPRDLSLELSLSYNIFPGSASTLSLFLENDNNFELSPCPKNNCLHFTGNLRPGISFITGFGSGNIYSRISTPFTYSFETLDLAITLGWISDRRFGVELSSYSLINPNPAYNGFDIGIYFQSGTLFSKITLGIPADLNQGLIISPELKFTSQSGIFSVYARGNIRGISSGTGGLQFYPVIGVMFNLGGNN